jgi:hypothetical protein
VTLDEDERLSTVRKAFGRVKKQLGADGVNLVTANGGWFISRVPQRRGRRPVPDGSRRAAHGPSALVADDLA